MLFACELCVLSEVPGNEDPARKAKDEGFARFCGGRSNYKVLRCHLGLEWWRPRQKNGLLRADASPRLECPQLEQR